MLRWIFRLIVISYAAKLVNRVFASRATRTGRI
jgi:hypothetical protein